MPTYPTVTNQLDYHGAIWGDRLGKKIWASGPWPGLYRFSAFLQKAPFFQKAPEWADLPQKV